MMFRSAAKRLLPYSSSSYLCSRISISSTPFRLISTDQTINGSPSSSSYESTTLGGGGGGGEEMLFIIEEAHLGLITKRNKLECSPHLFITSYVVHSLSMRLGWTEGAMIAGARDVGVSPSIVGAIPRKEGALVEYFMDECLQKLIDVIDSGELQLQDLVPSERIAKLVKIRLLMQAPYISKWPQALSIQAQPANFPTSFKQRAMLVDEFWHASSDEGNGVDWYVKRTVLGGIYSTTEVYMLTDNSPDFNDSWIFLNGRVRDAFDLKKTFQEVKYFAEAVGAGVGGSFQGFMKKGL
ncbi:hypothetical protein OSB04_031336 [Centaurea solstitialis]|uniref:Ubiquinone biosynthesis protein n=1 Tax=Centaurea solstitialis TaxID=347529 RepID=A0AA38SA53_9ASTR|nr:hypothetical protein OSB04_031336 [Centaurea solstitialis]